MALPPISGAPTRRARGVLKLCRTFRAIIVFEYLTSGAFQAVRREKRETVMASNADKELSDNLDQIRADISALTETVKTLVADTSGIQSSLKKKFDETRKQASHMGEQLLKEATDMGSDALHSAARQASKISLMDCRMSCSRS